MIRFAISVLLLLLSLLVLVKAPTNSLWKLAVAITEFPYLFVLCSAVLLISCFWAERMKLPAALLSALSLIIFSFPVVFAANIDSGLEKKMRVLFPMDSSADMLKEPFSLGSMFAGLDYKELTPQTFVYKKTKEKDLLIDFYAAAKKGKRPCVLVIHGGSWTSGDNKQLPELNNYLADKGYHVAAITYRLASLYKSPAPVEDTKEALNYLRANAEKLNIDTNNFVLLGRSAGGQIALVAAYSFNDSTIRGVVSYYAPADMVWGGQVKTNKLVLNTDKVFTDYLGGTYNEVPQRFYESSACEYVHAGCTPTLILHGQNDAMVSFHHAIRLNNKLDSVQAKHFLVALPFATHGCDYSLRGPSGQVTTYATERFINSVTSH